MNLLAARIRIEINEILRSSNLITAVTVKSHHMLHRLVSIANCYSFFSLAISLSLARTPNMNIIGGNIKDDALSSIVQCLLVAFRLARNTSLDQTFLKMYIFWLLRAFSHIRIKDKWDMNQSNEKLPKWIHHDVWSPKHNLYMKQKQTKWIRKKRRNNSTWTDQIRGTIIKTELRK